MRTTIELTIEELEELLSEAFDSGWYGYKDLKDSTIKDLIYKISNTPLPPASHKKNKPVLCQIAKKQDEEADRVDKELEEALELEAESEALSNAVKYTEKKAVRGWRNMKMIFCKN
jgi:hypothetical protein